MAVPCIILYVRIWLSAAYSSLHLLSIVWSVECESGPQDGSQIGVESRVIQLGVKLSY